MTSARRTGNGLLLVLVLAGVAGSWVWMTQPKEWKRGGVVLGRANCTPLCRARGGIADLFRPQEAPHCLCGSARTHW